MLLQVNAIIIAGLLILMTIQSSESISPRDLMLEGNIIIKNFEAFNETSNEIRESFKEKNWELDERTADFLIYGTYENTLEMAQFNKRAEIYDQLAWHEKIVLSSIYPANIILIPFALSALTELLYWGRQKDDNPTKLGVIFCYLGFTVMLAVFLGNLFIPNL